MTTFLRVLHVDYFCKVADIVVKAPDVKCFLCAARHLTSAKGARI